ncbi:hypothetical protein T439DRAFT_333271 [Meredithblackwellia eburnea MCA 4105]
MCQTAFVNSINDFCLFAIGDSERYEVAWCTSSGHGARIMPPGTITGAHYVQTPKYTQITGVGDFTKINVKAGDGGGELDPHGADGNGNPIGGLVYAGGEQIHEHIYDLQGCQWNMPGDYSGGSFDVCAGDAVAPPGVYTQADGSLSTYQQGPDPAHPTPAPPAHPAGATSNCQHLNGLNQAATPLFVLLSPLSDFYFLLESLAEAKNVWIFGGDNPVPATSSSLASTSPTSAIISSSTSSLLGVGSQNQASVTLTTTKGQGASGQAAASETRTTATASSGAAARAGMGSLGMAGLVCFFIQIGMILGQ